MFFHIRNSLLLVLLVACGGSSKSNAGGSETPTAAEPAFSKQEIAISTMCRELSKCALEDAKATMSAEELQKLKLEETLPQNQAECEEAFAKKTFTDGQIAALGTCFENKTSCEIYGDCCATALMPAKATSEPATP